MTFERDPVLQSLFDAADQDIADAAFTQRVMERLNIRRRQILLGRIAVVVAIVVLEVMLESPLSNSMGLVVDTLARDLVPVGDGWLGFLLAPVNSLAGLVGVTLLVINALFRRIIQ
ncbi:MAG: hypothetical protein ACFHX7_07255 [Pseudomonadota bacterium]